MPARPDPPGWLQAAALLAAALASLATPAPRHPRAFPAWTIEGTSERTVDGLGLRVWVAKSGKEGIGLTLRARADGRPRQLALRARISIAGEEVAQGALAPRAVGPEAHLYLPLPFDNERRWNRGENEGVLELAVQVDGRALEPWRLRLGQSRPGPHRRVDPQRALSPASRPRGQQP
jgi:hypothetical protein